MLCTAFKTPGIYAVKDIPRFNMLTTGGAFQVAREMPSYLFIRACSFYSSNAMWFDAWNPASQKLETYIVPKDYEITPVAHPEFEALYAAYQLAYLERQLSHTGAGLMVGSDPEIFVENAQGLMPAFTFLGSKAEGRDVSPTPMEGKFKSNRSPLGVGGYKIYWDGFQAEFETAADTCLGWQCDSIHLGLLGTLRLARKQDPTAKLSLKTVMDIPREMLETAAEEHVSLGCMPSKNAYGLVGMKVPPRVMPFRSAGGHIHMGMEFKSEQHVIETVKSLDAILGVCCVSLFQGFDDPRRRQFYGMAGEYRTPPHGLEYRVLSNAWLAHPAITNLVFDLARKAAMLNYLHGLLPKVWKGNEAEIIQVINQCDVKGAQALMNRNREIISKVMWAAYGNKERAAVAFEVFQNGMQALIANPEDIETNWLLDKGWTSHSDAFDKNVRTALDTYRAGGKAA